MTTDKLYTPFDGMPTRPDVEAIKKQWPELKAGDRISYEDMEHLLGMERNTGRFWTVTNVWRKQMRDQKIIIECERDKGFYVANAMQITGLTHGVLHQISRKAKKQRHKLATISDPIFSEMQTHQMRLMNMIEREAKKSRMNILPNTSIKETPQLIPPKKLSNNS